MEREREKGERVTERNWGGDGIKRSGRQREIDDAQSKTNKREVLVQRTREERELEGKEKG